MKGKNHSTEEWIWILRQADKGNSILDVCQESNINELTFHRWKRELGMLDLNQARRLKELEKENQRLKRLLADKVLNIENLQEALEISCEHRAQEATGSRLFQERVLQCTGRLPLFADPSLDLLLQGPPGQCLVGQTKTAIRRLPRQYSAWGYAKLAKLLKAEGWNDGKRLVQRLRRELGLRIPIRKSKKRRRGRSTELPTKAIHANHVWSWDFVHDCTVRGGALKMLTVLDEYTRECLAIKVDRNLNAKAIRTVMEELIEEHGAPGCIRSEYGSECIEQELGQWLVEAGVKTIYIEPGSPW